MAKKTSTINLRQEDVYGRLVSKPTDKIAKTLFLNVQNMLALTEKCKQVNEETVQWNKSNQKLPKEKRNPRRRKIKPCDIIDDLISRHLRGEI